MRNVFVVAHLEIFESSLSLSLLSLTERSREAADQTPKIQEVSLGTSSSLTSKYGPHRCSPVTEAHRLTFGMFVISASPGRSFISRR